MNIFTRIEHKIDKLKHSIETKRLTKKYPDYKDDEYNCGSLKFIWGVKSWDDLTGKDANMYTMNDIYITYDRETKLYSLGIETIYMFKDANAKCEYLRNLLNAFTAFMDSNNLSKDFQIGLFFSQPIIRIEADSLEELYANFKMYVEGYCKLYESIN